MTTYGSIEYDVNNTLDNLNAWVNEADTVIVGSNLVGQLVDDGHDIVILDKLL